MRLLRVPLLLPLLTVWTLLLWATPARAQQAQFISGGPTLPASCLVQSIFFKTGTGVGLYQCTATNTWTAVPTSPGAPATATYWVASANGSLPNAKNLGALSTGLVLNTAGVPTTYVGVTCSAQFLRVVAATGAGTCATVNLTADVAGTLPVLNGGTGTTTSTGSGSVVLSSSPTLVTPALGTPSALVLTNATGTPTSIGLANGTGLSLTTGVTGRLPFANLTQIAGLSLLGVTGNVTADVAAITAGTDNQVLRRSGTALSFGAVNLASSNAVTGNLPVTNLNSGTSAGATTFWRGDGTWATPTGTGNVSAAGTLTNNALVIGQGTTAVATTTTGTGVLTALGVNTGSAGALVVNGGALGTPSSGTLSSATGLPISTGVTGLGTGVATALAANVGSAGAPVTFNGAGGTPSSVTLTNGTGLPLTTGVTGTLPVANGGTGLTSGTSGGVLAYTASGTLASSGALTANLPVIGGGAGVAPTVGTRSGNTTAFTTLSGAATSGMCAQFDASGNLAATAAACGTGSGGGGGGAVQFIANNRLAVDTAQIQFTSIPQIYSHLRLICQVRSTEAVTNSIAWLRFNGDSGSNYDYQVAVGTNTTSASASAVAQSKGRLNEVAGSTAGAGLPGDITIDLPNYATTTFNKNWTSNGGSIFGTTTATALAGISTGMWRSTAAITQIDILPNANNFLTGSVCTLYGFGSTNSGPNTNSNLLAYTSYNPGTATDTSTASTTGADVDATNLSVTFTVPPSGKVLVGLNAPSYAGVAGGYWWVLRDTGGSNITGTYKNANSMASGGYSVSETRVVVTGLTPGASVTYRWGHGVNTALTAGHIRYGDDGTAGGHYGPAVMEVWDASTSTGVNANTSIVGGRLTTESGVCVSTSDRTAQSTIYYTPGCGAFGGNQITLYTGSVWTTVTFSELSLALSGLTSGKPYDVFLDYNSGSPILETVVWTNDTTRATALATQDGVLVQNADPDSRYLGTIYTTSTTATEDSAAKRYLWNYYNRAARTMTVVDTTDNWDYFTNTWRQANGSASNQVTWVTGDSATDVQVNVTATWGGNQNGSQFAKVGVGLDSTTAPSGLASAGFQSANATTLMPLIGQYRGTPGVGRHYAAWLEKGGGGVTFSRFYGDDGGSGVQSGIVGTLQN